MSAMSDYLETQIIKYWFQNDATVAARPATIYASLYTALPTDASASGTEVSGGSYARVAITCNATNFLGPTANDGTVTNGTAITFPVATGNWGTIVGVALYDAASTGNELWWGALSSSKVINSGDPALNFPVGSLSVQVDN